MKKKKTNKTINVKRIGMGGIFLRRLPLAICIMLLLCVFAGFYFDRKFSNYALDSMDTMHQAFLRQIEKENENYNGRNYRERLVGDLSIYYNRSDEDITETEGIDALMHEDVAAQVVDKDGNELIPTEERILLRIMHEGATPPEDFFCDPSLFEKAENEMKGYKRDPGDESEIYMELEDAYIDREKHTFIPGKVSVTAEEQIKGRTLIAEIEGDVSDTEGMEHITESDDNAYWLIMKAGIDTESKVYRDVMKHYSSDNPFKETGRYFAGARYMDKVVSPEGEVFTVYLAMYNEYGSLFFRAFGVSSAVIVVLTLLVMLFSSWRTSVIYKSHYAMEDYRREMTNTMAHDLKSPLMAISGCAEMLADGGNYDKAPRYADVILANVNYMNEIIANVLELAKLEGGRKPEPVDIELAQLTESLLEKYAEKLSSQGVRYSITGGTHINADRLMMSQALDNLLSNAVKYTPAGGSIDIRIDKDSLTVVNDSSEISSVPDEDLWKPFVKGDNARSSEKGSGIGLSIVREVCDVHGFSAELSRKDGKFEVTIRFKG